MLTVRHDSKRELDQARVKLRPGIQDTILQERNVSNNFIWVRLEKQELADEIFIEDANLCQMG